jgi:hypothetical protein
MRRAVYGNSPRRSTGIAHTKCAGHGRTSWSCSPFSIRDLIKKLGIVVRKTTFEPSKHGFRFANRFDLNKEDVGIPGQGPFKMGLCGGMCFDALARFHEGRSVPLKTIQPPTTGAESDLFWELYGRQTRTLLPFIWPKVLVWQVDTKHETLTVPGMFGGSMKIESGLLDENINVLTVSEEWPKLKKSLDDGKPIILVLIRMHGLGADPSENHQVVAIGYCVLEFFSRIIIDLYDPNVPGEISQLILPSFTQLNAGKGEDGSPVSKSFRGFFVLTL